MPTTQEFANKIIANLKLTAAERHELSAIETKHNICELLQWTEDYYTAFVYRTAMDFLVFYTNNDEKLIAKFEGNELFWNWFKNQWSNDDIAIVDYLHSLPPRKRYKQYEHFHNPRDMKEEVRISKTVLKSVLSQ